MRTHRTIWLLVLFASAMSCSEDSSPMSTEGASPTTPLSAEAAAKPSVEITYPQGGGDPLPPGDVLVALTVRSFGIDDDVGAEPKDGEGHLVYYLDVDKIPTKAGKSAIAGGPGKAEASSMTSHTWKNVGAGRHTLGVQLVNNDDTPLQPPATDEIDVVVGGG